MPWGFKIEILIKRDGKKNIRLWLKEAEQASRLRLLKTYGNMLKL